MAAFSRMSRYDVRNDGLGPYAVFYCDKCEREFRSQPDVKGTIAKDIGKEAVGGFLRRIPILGDVAADRIEGEDPRHTYEMTPQQLQAAWTQVQVNFRECPTCQQIVCLSDFDTQAGFCNDDSPRGEEIAQARAQQAAGVVKGFAAAFGLGDVVRHAAEAAKNAGRMARCPQDGTLAPVETKFCPQCGSPMVQPVADPCPQCGAEAGGAKFCPECGAKIERAAAATKCPNCGAEGKGAKFCPECGTKMPQAAAAPAKCANCGAELKGAKFCPQCGTKAG